MAIFEFSHQMHNFELCTYESISRINWQFLAQNVRMEILNRFKKFQEDPWHNILIISNFQVQPAIYRIFQKFMFSTFSIKMWNSEYLMEKMGCRNLPEYLKHILQSSFSDKMNSQKHVIRSVRFFFLWCTLDWGGG